MRQLFFKNLIFSLFLFSCYSSLASGSIYVAIDVSDELGRKFDNGRKYVINGVRGKNILGINHLITNAIKQENSKIKKKNQDEQIELLVSEFSIVPNLCPLITFLRITNVGSNIVEKIKKHVQKAIKKYRKKYDDGTFHFFIAPKSYFYRKKDKGKVCIVHRLSMHEGEARLEKLIQCIKKELSKNKIEFSVKPFLPNIPLVTVEAKDKRVIDLIISDKTINEFLASVKAPKGSENIKVCQIHLFDGSKKMHAFDI